MLDMINKHVAKIALVLKDGDSILSVSKRTGSSYGWTHRWIKSLEEIGAVEREGGTGIRIKDEELIDGVRGLARSFLRRKLQLKDAYLLPNFSRMKYAFTKTDAVFFWTKGGYQIGRSRESYPIFIKVLEDDLDDWKSFFEEYSVDCEVGGKGGSGIHYVLFPCEDFETEWLDNASVTPLEETVKWAMEHKPNFQPALEMLDEMYDLGLGVEYS